VAEDTHEFSEHFDNDEGSALGLEEKKVRVPKHWLSRLIAPLLERRPGSTVGERVGSPEDWQDYFDPQEE